MNHILFVCPLNKGKTLWPAAKNIFEHKGITWPQDMDHTYVMAAPLLKIKNCNGRTRIRASRLSTIVTLECAWLTWKARCKRVIGDEQCNPIGITDNKALNNLRLALNNRLRTYHSPTPGSTEGKPTPNNSSSAPGAEYWKMRKTSLKTGYPATRF